MREKTFPSRSRAVPRGLLGTLVLVALTEAMLARSDPHFANADVASYRFPGVAQREASRASILCFGDSLVKQGVIPAVLEERLGKSSYNLAVGGGMTAASYTILRRVLESGARPSAIIVDFTPTILHVDPRPLPRTMAALATLREGAEVGWVYGSADFATGFVLSRLLVSYRDRYELRALILSRIDRSVPTPPSHYAILWRNWCLNRGAQINAKIPGNGPEVSGPVSRLDRRWLCDRRNERFVVRFLDLAERYRVPVYWLIPPIHPTIQARRDESGADASFTAFVQAQLARHANVSVIDGRHAGYGPGLFVDVAHLDRDGAQAFTADVADVLVRQSAGSPTTSHWVSLTRRPRPGFQQPLEDIIQSMQVVAESRERSRR